MILHNKFKLFIILLRNDIIFVHIKWYYNFSSTHKKNSFVHIKLFEYIFHISLLMHTFHLNNKFIVSNRLSTSNVFHFNFSFINIFQLLFRSSDNIYSEFCFLSLKNLQWILILKYFLSWFLISAFK